jgi:hypothetical protein
MMKTVSPGLMRPSRKGDFFDGGRIFCTGALVRGAGIFGALGAIVARARRAAPGPQRRQQPTLADQAVDHDQGGDKQEEEMGDAPAPPGLFWLRGSAGGHRSACVLRHLSETVHQLKRKYKT